VLLKEVVRRVGEAGSNGVGRRARTPFGQTFNYPPARKYRAGCGDASSFFRILSSSGGGASIPFCPPARADRNVCPTVWLEAAVPVRTPCGPAPSPQLGQGWRGRAGPADSGLQPHPQEAPARARRQAGPVRRG